MFFPRVDPCSGWVWKVPAKPCTSVVVLASSAGSLKLRLAAVVGGQNSWTAALLWIFLWTSNCRRHPWHILLHLSAGNNLWAERKLLWQTSLKFGSFCWYIKNKWCCFSLWKCDFQVAWVEGGRRAVLFSGLLPLCLYNLQGFCPSENFKVFWNSLSRITCSLGNVCTHWFYWQCTAIKLLLPSLSADHKTLASK